MGARLQIWRQRLLPIRRVLVLVLLGLLLLLLLLVRWQAAQRAHQSRVLRWRQVSRPPAQVQRRLVGRHALRHSMLLHVWLLLQWRRRLVLVLLRLPRTGLLVVLQVVLLRTRLLRQVPLLRQMLLLLLVQPSGRRLVSWKAGRGTPQAGGSAWGARRLAARQPAGPDAAASPEERCDGLLGLRGGRVRLLLGDGGGRRRRRCRSLGRAQAAAAKQGAVGAIGRLLGLLTALLLQQREQCGALLGSSATDAASQCLTGRLVRRLVQAQSAQLGQEVCLGRAHGLVGSERPGGLRKLARPAWGASKYCDCAQEARGRQEVQGACSTPRSAFMAKGRGFVQPCCLSTDLDVPTVLRHVSGPSVGFRGDSPQ